MKSQFLLAVRQKNGETSLYTFPTKKKRDDCVKELNKKFPGAEFITSAGAAKNPLDKTLKIRLSAQLLKSIRAVAKSKNCTVSELIRGSVEAAVSLYSR